MLVSHGLTPRIFKRGQPEHPVLMRKRNIVKRSFAGQDKNRRIGQRCESYVALCHSYSYQPFTNLLDDFAKTLLDTL